MQRSNQEIEGFLQSHIAELNLIVQGLKGYEPFLRMVERWKKTNESLDNSWHLFTDPVKFNDARITKFAAMELINCVEHLEADLQKARIELAKLQNPVELQNKDVDNEGEE